jgi:hypothetical protein
MPKPIVVDSGPLIALFDKDDTFHVQAVEFIRKLTSEIITNYAVVTEVTHLLDFNVSCQRDFLSWILDGGITVVEITSQDLVRIIDLMQKYADLPIDFTDASLIALCERIKIHDVASIDKDFTIFRTKDKKPFKNVFFR